MWFSPRIRPWFCSTFQTSMQDHRGPVQGSGYIKGSGFDNFPEQIITGSTISSLQISREMHPWILPLLQCDNQRRLVLSQSVLHFKFWTFCPENFSSFLAVTSRWTCDLNYQKYLWQIIFRLHSPFPQGSSQQARGAHLREYSDSQS